MLKSLFALLFFTAALGPAIGDARAQPASTWRPDRPVRVIVPTAAGGSLDFVGRAFAQGLSADMGQSFVVVNRPGANGSIAISEALRADADGHTLILVTTTMVAVNPAIYRDLKYDALKDFAPVGTLAVVPAVLVAALNFPANDARELVALAKSKPNELNYASTGAGAFSNLTFEMLKERAGINIVHVPYKGESDSLVEIMAGRASVAILTLASALPFINDKRIKALGVLSPQRLSVLPQVPTMEEQGFNGFNPQLWYGVVAAKGTAPNVISAYQVAVDRMLAKPELQANFAKQSLVPLVSNPAEFTSRMTADIALYGAVVKSAGIRVE